jgi:hypothetical protein
MLVVVPLDAKKNNPIAMSGGLCCSNCDKSGWVLQDEGRFYLYNVGFQAVGHPQRCGTVLDIVASSRFHMLHE